MKAKKKSVKGRCELGPERLVLTDGLQPNMVRSAKGALWVQAGGTPPPGFVKAPRNAFGNTVIFARSTDGGRTWQRWMPKAATEATVGPGELGLPETRHRLGLPLYEGAAAPLADGSVLLVEWIADGPDPAGNFAACLWESHDDLETFTGPFPATVPLPQAKIGYDDNGHPYSGVTFHRTLLPLPGGDILATVYCWFQGDDTPCPYQPRMKKFRCILLRSSDRGRNWRYVSTIAVDPSVGEEGFDEPVMVRMTRGPHAGRLLCLMRTGSNDCPVYQATSDDEGVTWSKPLPIPVNGVDPDLVEAADGTLVGVVGRRDWRDQKNKCYYQLILSEDGGERWEIAAAWKWEPHSGVEQTTSYAAICETEPGRLYVVYDIGVWSSPVRYIGGREVHLRPRG